MKFSVNDEMEFQRYLCKIMRDEKTLQMKKYIQHGVVSTYEHCENVARVCFKINKAIGEKADMETLLRSAFLHDFYLYDWHEKKLKNKIHGFTHPKVAAKNAKKYFNISEKEQQIIRSHMWPLTVFRMPMSREAWILCLADKYCSGLETATMRKEKRNLF